MMNSRVLALAEEEMLEAATFYESQATGLGGGFLRKIQTAVQDIKTNPERWPMIGDGIRRRLIQRFPYAVLYQADDSEIVIVAVMHLNRRPNYWMERV